MRTRRARRRTNTSGTRCRTPSLPLRERYGDLGLRQQALVEVERGFWPELRSGPLSQPSPARGEGTSAIDRVADVHGTCELGLMARSVLGFILMFIGPWIVWLAYAHFFRDFGAQRELTEAALIGIALVVGSLGAIALGSRFSRWSLSAKLAAYAAYGILLTLAMPWIALVSVCTTGDCV